MDLVEQSNYENSDIEKQIVDVQFDSYRENALWVLLCHTKLSLYTLTSMTLDTTKTKNEFYTHIANEEHVFSPSLFKQN